MENCSWSQLAPGYFSTLEYGRMYLPGVFKDFIGQIYMFYDVVVYGWLYKLVRSSVGKYLECFV